MIRESFGEKCRDLALACSKSEVVPGPAALTRTREDPADDDLSTGDRGHRVRKSLGWSRFRQHTTRARGEDGIELFGRERPRVHHDGADPRIRRQRAHPIDATPRVSV